MKIILNCKKFDIFLFKKLLTIIKYNICMIVNINNNSKRKQYLERDNLLLVDNDEIVRIDCGVSKDYFRFPTIFNFVSALLELNKWEKELYYLLNYRRDEFDSFYHMTKIAAKLFNRHERSYNRFYRSMQARGIVTIDENNKPHIGAQYDIENFSNRNYIIVKINDL